MNYKISFEEAKEALTKEKEFPFVALLHHGTMSVEFYAPKEIDLQEPHRQDEIYVIASGRGEFYCGNQKMKFKKGDLFFVPAGMEHRFHNFSPDFATWVIFYGPDGGE
jgi:mannose-6-phosphate isomerase-like protein (cupin superfamily)